MKCNSFNTISVGCRFILTAPVPFSRHGITTIYILLFFLSTPILIIPSHVSAQTSPPSSSSTASHRPPENYKALDGASMAIVVLVILLAFISISSFSIWIRHCVDSPNSSAGGIFRPVIVGGGNSSADFRCQHGLDKSVIDSFPTVVYSSVKELKIGKGSLECAVCLSEFKDCENLRLLLPKCDHVFHSDCIDVWLLTHSTCPVCRADLGVPNDSNSDEKLWNRHNELERLARIRELVERRRGSCGVGGVRIGGRRGRGGRGRGEVRIDVVDENSSDGEDDGVVAGGGCGGGGSRGSGSGMKKFLRSNSTGHSLIRLGVDCERFTLRLPDEVMKQILNGGSSNYKLKRASSCVALPRVSSCHR